MCLKFEFIKIEISIIVKYFQVFEIKLYKKIELKKIENYIQLVK